MTTAKNIAEVAKMKYKAAIIPLLIVFFSFLIAEKYSNSKYLTLVGLAYYLFILLLYRINRSCVVPKEMEVILSPIAGKVTDILENDGTKTVKISKKFYHFADIRNSYYGDNPQFGKNEIQAENEYGSWTLSGGSNRKLKSEEDKCRGVLSGVNIMNAVCFYKLGAGVELAVKKGDILVAGESILGHIL